MEEKELYSRKALEKKTPRGGGGGSHTNVIHTYVDTPISPPLCSSHAENDRVGLVPDRPGFASTALLLLPVHRSDGPTDRPTGGREGKGRDGWVDESTRHGVLLNQIASDFLRRTQAFWFGGMAWHGMGWDGTGRMWAKRSGRLTMLLVLVHHFFEPLNSRSLFLLHVDGRTPVRGCRRWTSPHAGPPCPPRSSRRRSRSAYSTQARVYKQMQDTRMQR